MIDNSWKMFFLATGLLFLSACSDTEAPQSTAGMHKTVAQKVFATPEQVAQAFTDALINKDGVAMHDMMGADYEQLVSFTDEADIEAYLAGWQQAHQLIAEGGQQVVLSIGDNGWTFPVPIVQDEKGWYFDTDAGIDRILIRQIGRNELDAMQAVLAYYDAQLDYARKDRNENGILEYAQKFKSTVGNKDGLFWDVTVGEEISPLGSLFAGKADGESFLGYEFKILKQQGNAAQGGAFSYLDRDRMDRGFALIAWPANYAESGITSFMVSHSGIVYEQDLGKDSAKIAAAMDSFDPDSGWKAEQGVY